MADLFTLSATDLAALLCSRVCHDIISPVGAINNGLELLDEGGADADAMDLIRTSALNASVRLKFARLAFGASGSVGASIDTGEAEKAAKDFAAAEKKTEVSWNGPRAIIAKNRVKLLLNLFLVAYGSIPRGGSLDITLENPEFDAAFTIVAKGRMMRVPQKFAEICSDRLGCAMWCSAAAAENVPSRAAVRKYCSCRTVGVAMGARFVEVCPMATITV